MKQLSQQGGRRVQKWRTHDGLDSGESDIAKEARSSNETAVKNLESMSMISTIRYLH